MVLKEFQNYDTKIIGVSIILSNPYIYTYIRNFYIYLFTYIYIYKYILKISSLTLRLTIAQG